MRPDPDDLSKVGTIAIMHKALRMPTENLLLFCEGVDRIEVEEYTATEPFLRAKVRRLPDVEPETTPEIEALRQNVLSTFQQIVAGTPNLSDDLITQAQQIQEPGRLADFVAGTLPSLSHPERQELLEDLDALSRLRKINRHLTREHGTARAARQDPVGGARASSRRASANSICASS